MREILAFRSDRGYGWIMDKRDLQVWAIHAAGLGREKPIRHVVAGEALGVHPRTFARWLDGALSPPWRVLAYACTAVIHRLTPYDGDLYLWRAQNGGLTQAEASAALGVDIATWRRWESGQGDRRIVRLAMAALSAGLPPYEAEQRRAAP